MAQMHQKLEKIKQKMETMKAHAEELDNGPGNNPYDQEYAAGMLRIIENIEGIIND